MTYGQKLMTDIAETLLGITGIRDYRPEWLFGMEIDLYFPSLGIGLEFQGDQHYIPVYGTANLLAQKSRDKRKRQICRERGEVLMSIDASELSSERIKMKLKWARKHLKKCTVYPIRKASAAKHLDKECATYRATLKKSFHSPSAIRSKAVARVIEELEAGVPFRSWMHRKLSTTQQGRTYLEKLGITPFPAKN